MEQLNTSPHRPESHTEGVFFKLTNQFSEPLHTTANNCMGISEIAVAFGNPKGAMDW